MTPQELNRMPLVKQAVVAQLSTLCHLAQMSHDTIEIAMLIHAINGASILGREKELLDLLHPHIMKMKAEAEALLEEVEAQVVKNRTVETKDDKADSDYTFFDDNDLIG